MRLTCWWTKFTDRIPARIFIGQMPMPQRKPRLPTHQQLLSNNLSNGRGFYGTAGVSSSSTSTALATISAAAGGGGGGLQAAAAAAAAAILNPQPPPLITDTLTACLDINGTYICSSYSPRCYIIQKVIL